MSEYLLLLTGALCFVLFTKTSKIFQEHTVNFKRPVFYQLSSQCRVQRANLIIFDYKLRLDYVSGLDTLEDCCFSPCNAKGVGWLEAKPSCKYFIFICTRTQKTAHSCKVEILLYLKVKHTPQSYRDSKSSLDVICPIFSKQTSALDIRALQSC